MGSGREYEVLDHVGRNGFAADAAIQRVHVDMVVLCDEELALLLFLFGLLRRPLFCSLLLDVFRSGERDFLLDGLRVAGERLLARHRIRCCGLGINEDACANIGVLLLQTIQVASLELQLTVTTDIHTRVGFFALWETDSAASRI